MFGIKISGMDLLDKEFDSLEKRMTTANVVATRTGGNVVKKAAQTNIHSTGDTHGDPLKENLRKHIVTRVYKKRPTNSIALVGPLFPGQTAQQKSYYGDWVEEGHKMEFGNSTVPPHPYLRPALDESTSQVNAKMAQVYQKALNKNFNPESILSELGENLVDSILSDGDSNGSDADFNG